MRNNLLGKNQGENNPMYGKKHTEITKEKMRIKRKKYFDNGGVGYWKGKYLSKESIEKTKNTKKRLRDEGKLVSHRRGISMEKEYGKEKAKQLKQHLATFNGNKASGWRGGISRMPYDFNFNKILKTEIKERDNFECQICNKHNNNTPQGLFVHHIDYNKLNSKKDNLISLCGNCHSKTNYNRHYWKWQLKVFMNLFHNANHELNMKYIKP